MHKTYCKKVFSYRVGLVPGSWIHATHRLADRFIWMQPVHKRYPFTWRMSSTRHVQLYV